jgi:DNA processing protein
LGQPRERRPAAQAPLAFEPPAARPPPAPGPDADDPAERVAALLGPTPVAFDTLVRAAGLPPEALSAALLDLDLAGRISRLPGDMVALAPA